MIPSKLTIRRETCVDYKMTAARASEAFDRADGFHADDMAWLYNQGFGHGHIAIAVTDGETKVGQVVMVRQALQAGGKTEMAALFVDIFVLKAYRSAALMVRLFRHCERACREEGIRFLIGVPNEKAGPVVKRFLRPTVLEPLPIDVDLAWRWPGTRPALSTWLADMPRGEAIRRFDAFLDSPGGDAVNWDGETLYGRLQRRQSRYAVHANDRALVVTTRRRLRHIATTFVCATLTAPGTTACDVAKLFAAACRFHRLPWLVYVGFNHAVSHMPGLKIPAALRPTPMTLAIRDLEGDIRPQFGRYESVDFDFA